MKTRYSSPLIVLLACALGTSIAACGSSGSSTTSSSAPSPSASTTSAAASPSTSSATTAGNATAEITTNWTAFFNPKSPIAKRVSLLQNGSKFASVIQAQAGSTLASQASAKVDKVTVTSATQAKVIYTILFAGTPALSNVSGVAVLENGTWKVGDVSFCSLLTLENNGKPMAVCKSVA